MSRIQSTSFFERLFSVTTFAVVMYTIAMIAGLITIYYVFLTGCTLVDMVRYDADDARSLGGAIGSAFANMHTTSQVARFLLITVLALGIGVTSQLLNMIRTRIRPIRMPVDLGHMMQDNTDRQYDQIDRLECLICSVKEGNETLNALHKAFNIKGTESGRMPCGT